MWIRNGSFVEYLVASLSPRKWDSCLLRNLFSEIAQNSLKPKFVLTDYTTRTEHKACFSTVWTISHICLISKIRLLAIYVRYFYQFSYVMPQTTSHFTLNTPYSDVPYYTVALLSKITPPTLTPHLDSY